MKLIAIFGPKRSGKDTVSDYIVDNCNGIKFQLGKPIKDLLASSASAVGIKLTKDDFHGEGIDREKTLPISNIQVHELMKKCVEYAKIYYGFRPNNIEVADFVDNVLNNTDAWSIRRLMQTLGTDICVASDKNVWVRYFAGVYVEALESGQFDYFVVPDVRQTHENTVMRQLGAKCVHIEKEVINLDTHITEQKLAVLDGDIIIDNTGTLEELYPQINLFLKDL